jgi:hypothetical protein
LPRYNTITLYNNIMRLSIISAAAFLANALLVTGRGGSHGGGGGGGGGDGTSDGAGQSSLYYYADECYDELNPTPKNLGGPGNYTTAQPGDQWYIYQNNDDINPHAGRSLFEHYASDA